MKRVLAVFAMTLLVGAVTGVTAAAGADARIDTPSGALVIHFDEGECGIVLQPPFQGLELEGRGTAVFTAANPNIELITCAGPVPKSLGITQTLRYELTVPGGGGSAVFVVSPSHFHVTAEFVCSTPYCR